MYLGRGSISRGVARLVLGGDNLLFRVGIRLPVRGPVAVRRPIRRRRRLGSFMLGGPAGGAPQARAFTDDFGAPEERRRTPDRSA